MTQDTNESKQCPVCNTPHTKKGIYCQRACACKADKDRQRERKAKPKRDWKAAILENVGQNHGYKNP